MVMDQAGWLITLNSGGGHRTDVETLSPYATCVYSRTNTVPVSGLVYRTRSVLCSAAQSLDWPPRAMPMDCDEFAWRSEAAILEGYA
jgi:hypothetical protein